MRSPESFEKFYFAKVGRGEACGYAERIIDVYEFNRKSGAIAKHVGRRGKTRLSLRSLALRYGLISRPRQQQATTQTAGSRHR
ncbi:MAG: hypothetical protein ACR2O2_10580 [Ruegeria sp.]